MQNKTITTNHCIKLIEKYADEIKLFSSELSGRFQRDNKLHGRGAFSDLEGALLYSLIRELKPQLVYEISPDTGLSTNYIVLALQANNSGKAVGFELEKSKTWKQIKTWEVIRQNQVSKSAYEKHYELVIGDAIKNTEDRGNETPDITVIDSCHERFFAEWYVANIINKTRLLALIQDITYSGMREESGEAAFVNGYIEKNKIGRIVIDNIDEAFSKVCLNKSIEPVRRMMTNSILVGGKQLQVMEEDEIPFASTATERSKVDYLNMNIRCSESQFEARNWAKCISLETDTYKLLYMKDRLISSIYSSFCKTKDIGCSLRCLAKVVAGNADTKKKLIAALAIGQIGYCFPLYIPRLLLVKTGLMSVTTP